jgi:superfamily II DNA or RNA helicase
MALTYGYKTIIITHENTIKTQWVNSFMKMTNIDMGRVLELSVSTMEALMEEDRSDDYDVFLINHQSVSSFAKNNGWDAVREFFKKYYIGVKIVDESHKFFENSLMIDFFSNTFKTFYLTATFLRNDRKENQIYMSSYAETVRFGEQTFDYESKRKHIVAIIVLFMSRPRIGQFVDVSTRRGFSVYKYIDYELSEENHTLKKILFKLMDESMRLEGKRLILVPKKSTIDYVAELVEEKYPNKSVGKIYSDNTPEENEKSKEKDIIISTAKSSGTGLDIKGLRVMYNLEPISSPGYLDQVRGRLREYAPDKDTFMYYPVDTTIPECNSMIKRILPVLKRKCKEVIVYRIDDI